MYSDTELIPAVSGDWHGDKVILEVKGGQTQNAGEGVCQKIKRSNIAYVYTLPASVSYMIWSLL